MDDRERYFWDLNGYLIVRNVLTPDEVVAANKAIDRHSAQIKTGKKGAGARGSERLAGTGRPTLAGLLELEKPHCDPFRNMLAHPAMVARMNVMSGPGFRLDHGPVLIATNRGTEGLAMHGSGEPFKPYVAYHHQNGTTYCGGVTVTWQLTDMFKGDGGFAIVPGTHKSGFPIPEGVRLADNDMGLILQMEMMAGDAVFFMDGALTHGTLPWVSDRQRRSVLFKYASRTAVRSGPAAQFAPPETYWGKDLVDGMTDEQLAVMYGPYSNSRGAVPFLKVNDDGAVEAYRMERPPRY
jgi:ectoine hydroxylase-related dioxygenase (phytanoyl-CoA dioxygenase family)